MELMKADKRSLAERQQSLSKQCVKKAEEEDYASLMNDTKWRELCLAFHSLEEATSWRTHDFINGYLSQWDRDWFHHVGPDYVSIEWLEINCENCAASKIRHILLTLGVSFEEAEHFKVFGYKTSKATTSSKLRT